MIDIGNRIERRKIVFKKGLVIQREMMQTGGDKHNKDLAEIFHNLAGLYARNGRLRKAIDNYQRAVEF